jgi:transcriptional regulator of heat shock response
VVAVLLELLIQKAVKMVLQILAVAVVVVTSSAQVQKISNLEAVVLE